MLLRRQLPALILPVTAPRAAQHVLHVAAIGPAAALLEPLAQRVAMLSGGALRLQAGPGGAVLGALASGEALPHPALLPFAGFPFGMGAAELAHWLGTADGRSLWATGFRQRGLQAWPVAIATREGGRSAPAHGTVIELRSTVPVVPAFAAVLAAAGDSTPIRLPVCAWNGPPATPARIANWLRDRLHHPEAVALQVAERYAAARITALEAGAFNGANC